MPVITDPMKDKENFLTEEQLRAFLAVIKLARDRLLFLTMYATGRRVSEVLALRPIDLRPEEGTALFVILKKRPSKDGEQLRVRKAIPPILMKQLTEWCTGLPEDRPMFDICRSWAYRLAVKYGELAGLPKKVRPHTLRHSFATNMVREGAVKDIADLTRLQHELEHSSIDMTAHYLQFQPGGEMAEAKIKLFEKVTG